MIGTTAKTAVELMSRSIAFLVLFLMSNRPAFPQENPGFLHKSPAALGAYNKPEAYKVYAAVLPLDQMGRESKTLIIRANTEPYKADCLIPDKKSQELVNSAIENYKQVNERVWLLQPQFDVAKPYKVFSMDDIAVFNRDAPSPHFNFEGLTRNFPGTYGYIELSAVGFNSDKTIAVVYIGHYYGPLGAGGEFHVLEKKDGEWKPLKWGGTTCGWLS